MKASFFSSSRIGKACLFLFLFPSCSQKSPSAVHRSFYYWKSAFSLTATERSTVKQLSVNHLHVKFFDVEWNSAAGAPQPVALLRFGESAREFIITPVVFITGEAIQKASLPQIDTLAGNLALLLSRLCTQQKIALSGEVQIDHDWTGSTKEKYFRLLTRLRQTPFFRGKQLSATIRLHQVKFLSEAGIPPVDKGLLMCYNMGTLRWRDTRNSIIDIAELKKYTGRLQQYPLSLDVALPIFDWYVWFRQGAYKGLLHSYDVGRFSTAKENLTFKRDTVLNGFTFEGGDWLRYEGSEATVIQAAGELVKSRRRQKAWSIILYHLDEQNLNKYNLHELETMYNSFR